jgi:hypothetical protein
MAIRTTDFAGLTDDLQSITNEVRDLKIADMGVASMLFSAEDEVRKTHDELVLHGLSGVAYTPEGSDFPRATSDQGDSITWTQAQYGLVVPVTYLMRRWDLYNQITDQAESAMDDAMDKLDQSLVDMLLYGFAATAYTDVWGLSVTPVGPDSLSLFSSAHSNPLNSNTFSNLINDGSNNNPALSRAAIVNERARALRYTDPNGLTRPVRLDCVVVGPTNEDLAERILFSNQIPGEANNDLNALKGKIKQLKVWERLDLRSDSTDTSAYWFMAESSKVKKTLRTYFTDKPQLQAPETVHENGDWEYVLRLVYSRGFSWASYLRGSTGVN